MKATTMFKRFDDVRKAAIPREQEIEKYILVASDNPIEARVVCGYLENFGYKYKEASTGQEAIKTIQNTVPMLVISSLAIPGIKGYQLCQMLKGNPATSSVPVILISDSDTTPDRVEGFQLGCDDYITKPLDPGILKVRVEALLRRSKQFEQIKTTASHQNLSSVKTVSEKEISASTVVENSRESVSEPRAIFKTVTAEPKKVSDSVIKPSIQATPADKAEVIGQEVKKPAPQGQKVTEKRIEVKPADVKTTIQPEEPVKVRESLDAFREEIGKSIAQPSSQEPIKSFYKPESGARDFSSFRERLRTAAEAVRPSIQESAAQTPTVDKSGESIIPSTPESKPIEVKPEISKRAEDHIDKHTILSESRAVQAPTAETATPKAAVIPAVTAPKPADLQVQPQIREPQSVQSEPEKAAPDRPVEIIEASKTEEQVQEVKNEGANIISPAEEKEIEIAVPVEPVTKKIGAEVMIKAEAKMKLALPSRRLIQQADAKTLYQYGLDIINILQESSGKFGSEEFLAITAYCDKLAEAATANNILLSQALGKSTEPSLAAHMVNCSIIALRIGKNLQLQAGELSLLGAAALLFDLGMINVDPAILNKRSEISDSERKQVQAHVKYSIEFIETAIKAEFEQECKYLTTAIYQHHERQEGQGYPNKMIGEKISRGGKILGIADTYEALCHSRYHRSRQTTYRALQEVVGMKKTYFDPIILRALVNELTFFPIGCYVKLNTEEIGVVTDVSPVHSMRPKIKILVDNEGVPLDLPKTVDLVQSPFLYVVKPLEDEDIPLDIG